MSSNAAAQAESLFAEGKAHAGAGRHEAALKAYDGALALTRPTFKLLDAKAAVLRNMGVEHRDKALEVASASCKKFGDKEHRAWGRLAGILIDLHMFEQAEKSIARGERLASPKFQDRYAELRSHAARQQQRAEAARVAAMTPTEAAAHARAKARAKQCFAHLLSADVLINVALAGMLADPDIAPRMAAVCTEWRAAMLAYPFLWSRLELGTRKPLAKAKLFKERSKGRLKALTIRERLPDSGPASPQSLAQELISCVSGMEEITLLGNGARAYWALQVARNCAALRHLHVVHEGSSGGLLRMPPPAPRLETVHLENDPGTAISTYVELGNAPPLLRQPFPKLPALRRFHLNDSAVSRGPLQQLLNGSSALEELIVRRWLHELHVVEEDWSDPIELLRLERLELVDVRALWYKAEDAVLTAPEVCAQLHCPALKHLVWADKVAPPLSHIRRPGLNLAGLVSLELASCKIRQDELLELLPQLSRLRYLNVEGLPLNNDFIEALEASPSRDVLLPNLTALNVSALEITASPLRRLLASRLPDRLAAKAAAPQAVNKAVQLKASGMFRPAKRAKVEVTKLGSQISSGPTTATVPTTAPMTWLSAYGCPQLDVDVLLSLSPYLRSFQWRSRPVAGDVWDMGELGNCPADSDCQIRKRPDGKWGVDHACSQ